MDGQRRLDQPLKAQARAGARRSAAVYGLAGRMSGILFLTGALFYGLNAGGHLDYQGSPWRKLPGKLSGIVGYAADDIRIGGLEHHDPERVLAAIGVKPGDSLIGFDAERARDLLQNLDWVRSAKVTRQHPNTLDIVIAERQPFAVWQRDGGYYLIDRSGSAMSSGAPGDLTGKLLLTGEGAEQEAARLVNLLEANPAILSRVRAASRVGRRRWTLHLDNGVKIALPEQGADLAIATALKLDHEQGLLSKGISMLDLRLSDRITIAVAEVKAEEAKVSRR
jgi:cell division protein FtsQ